MPDRAKQIFNTGKIYSDSAKILNHTGNPRHNLPSQVIAALSLELYFKCIYYLEKGQDFKINNKHSHDFFNLFEQLEQSTKDYIISEYNTLIQKRDVTDIKLMESYLNKRIDIAFLPLLENWSDIFVKGRYFHEKNLKGKNMIFFPELELILINCIYLKRPDWK